MARRSKLQIVCALAIFTALCVNPIQGAQDSLRDYDVKVSLYRPSDETERTMQQPLLTLTTITVPPVITSVRQLLASAHLYASSESAGLIYTLNPALRDPLHPGENVRITRRGRSVFQSAQPPCWRSASFFSFPYGREKNLDLEGASCGWCWRGV
jgi:hypothetical protein